MAYYSKRRSYGRRRPAYKSKSAMRYKRRSYKSRPYAKRSQKMTCSCSSKRRMSMRNPYITVGQSAKKALSCIKSAGSSNPRCVNLANSFQKRLDSTTQKIGVRANKLDASFKKRQQSVYDRAHRLPQQSAPQAAGGGGAAASPAAFMQAQGIKRDAAEQIPREEVDF